MNVQEIPCRPHREQGYQNWCLGCMSTSSHNARPPEGGDRLHHPNGTHRSTPPTANGHELELHEAAIRRHLADGHTHEVSQ